MFDLFLGTITTVKGKGDENKTDDQMFVDAVGTMIALVAENKGVKSTFVGKNYVPFAEEMKNRGYAEVVGYLVLHHTGTQSATAWLGKNQAKLKEFIAWSKSYSMPEKN